MLCRDIIMSRWLLATMSAENQSAAHARRIPYMENKRDGYETSRLVQPYTHAGVQTIRPLAAIVCDRFRCNVAM